MHELARHWWALGLRGVLSLIIGVIAIVFPPAAIFALVAIFGAYALVDGIFAIVAAIRLRSGGANFWSLIVEGIFGIAAGVLTFVWPGITALALDVIIGVWAILTGVFAISSAIRLRQTIPGEWWWILNGVLSVAFGLLVLFLPGSGLVAIAFILGFYAILAGFTMIGLAWRLRSHEPAVSGV